MTVIQDKEWKLWDKLKLYINKGIEQKHILNSDAHGWSQRIKRVKSVYTTFWGSTRHRQKRGLFDFVGEISHGLFGVATKKCVEKCKQLMYKCGET